MKFERIFISSLPAIFFFLGIIFLAISPLNMSRVITIQHESFNIFMEELMKYDIVSAFFMSLNYVWVNAIWIILVFLVFITTGLLIYVLLLPRIKHRVVLISMIVFLILSFIVSNFSIPMLLIAFSLFIGILWMSKTFVPRRNNFSTGYFVISSRLGLLNIFLAIGIFLAILMNMQAYEQQISESNERMLASLIPNATDVKDAQKKQIEELTEGFKSSLKFRYQTSSSSVRNQCKPLYEGMMTALDDYKDRSFEKIEKSELSVMGKEVEHYFPFFDILEKLTPLSVAFSAYFLVYVLIPVMGIFAGIVYSIARGRKRK